MCPEGHFSDQWRCRVISIQAQNSTSGPIKSLLFALLFFEKKKKKCFNLLMFRPIDLNEIVISSAQTNCSIHQVASRIPNAFRRPINHDYQLVDKFLPKRFSGCGFFVISRNKPTRFSIFGFLTSVFYPIFFLIVLGWGYIDGCG